MSKPFARLRRFLRELKQRNVYKVGATYLVAAFVVWQVADFLFPALQFPAWTVGFTVIVSLLGFPLALIVAWAFEMTPEGMRRTGTPEGEESVGATYQWIALALVVALAGGVWYATTWSGGEGTTSVPAVTDTARAASAEADRSIAVLPFDNLSGTEEAEPFVNGIHDDLLTRLSNISDLKVISRTSVLPYRETNLSLPAIADSLGVTWIVEGGVQQAADRVQVNAQLIQAEEDAHRWAESYRRELTTENLFAVQSELTKKIARSLEAQLTSAEQTRIERQPTESLEAYRLYVEGRRLLARRGPDALEEAVTAFRRALDRDSAYALAWAGLADALGLGAFYDVEVPESVPGARTAARRALELDPDLAEAHASMGFVYFLNQDGPAALRELERAVELKPSYAQAQHWLGASQLALGRPESALRHLTLAVELSPHHKTAREWLAGAYLANGQPEKAVREAREARRNTANEVPPFALLQLGRLKEAREVAKKALSTSVESEWGDPHQRAALVIASVMAGDSAGAREQLARFGDEGAGPAARGVVHAALGEHEDAFRAFENVERWGLASGRSVLMFRYQYAEILAPLLRTPRYDRLIRKYNQQWGLNPDGSLPDSVDVSFEPQSDE